jgi:hypothetical protein
MRFNDAGACVYWQANPLPLSYECLNDGTCAQSMGGTHRTFFDLPTCQSNCGQGKWQCMLNAQNSGCAEDHAVMCVPDARGKCADLASCEKACGHESTRVMPALARERTCAESCGHMLADPVPRARWHQA